MSDIAGTEPAAVGDVAAAAPAADTSSSSTTESYAPIDLPDGQQLFERSYVEKLRSESAGYRTQLRELEQKMQQPGKYQILDDYDDDDRAVWLGLAETWQSDPYAAAEQMRTIASRVLGDIEQGNASDEFYDDLEDAEQEAGGELTQEQVQRIVQAEMQRQAAAQEMESMVGEVFAEIKQAGIDPNSMDGYMVLWRASNETNGDIQAALAAHEQYRQSVIDGYVQGKAKGGTTPLVPNGTTGVQRVEPKNLDDAFKAGREFLKNTGGMS
ncbi:MAG: hypothetical protein RL134_2533 [Actinomycetota bacterium]|jgi:hypothetical protein